MSDSTVHTMTAIELERQLADRDEQTLKAVVAALLLAGESTAAQLVSDLRDRLMLASGQGQTNTG